MSDTHPTILDSGRSEATLGREQRGSEIVADPVVLVDWEDLLQQCIAASSSIPETTRKALIQARRGQGRFKENVHRIEHQCRITGIFNPTHLIASQIKPWRESTDEERLAGSNGLLLTPSMDHLFDRGFMTFADDGEALISPVADGESLTRMGISSTRRLQVAAFNAEQRHFLRYHRDEFF